ncbi:Tetratricopeptide SHNi-TPR domain [Trinorchestia longiramus]|nr:Tetratricopeptide SHNi-TPR domain [Trinorchestia longiramus]
MVAAPETKAASEVVVSKNAAQDPPSAADELKSKSVEKMECAENAVEKPEEAEPSGSNVISLENSAKLEKACEKLAAGKKALLQSQPQQAVDALAEACALQSAVHGDMSNSMCEFYYYYGRALLDLARIEGDVLGNALSGVPEGEDMDNSQVEDPDKLTEEEKESVAQQVDEALEENFKKNEGIEDESMETDENKKDELDNGDKNKEKACDKGKDAKSDEGSKSDKKVVEKDSTSKEKDSKSEEKDESKSEKKDESKPEEKDESKSEEKDESKSEKKDESKSEKKDESKSEKKDESKSAEKDESKSAEKDESKSAEKDESKSAEKDGSKSAEKDESKSAEKDGSKSAEKDESKSEEKAESKSEEKAESKSAEKDESKPKKEDPNSEDKSKSGEKDSDSHDVVASEDVEMMEVDEDCKAKGEKNIVNGTTEEDQSIAGNVNSAKKHQLGRLVSESACERKDPGSNPAADMVDAARNTAWDLEDKSDKEDGEEEEEGDNAEEEGEEAADEDTQESQEEEEDVPSLQLAWEVLELAKTIYEKNEKPSDDDKTKLSQVYLKLGEVSLENENYPESINMYSECLKLQESILAADDRWLAETHYQLGLAHSLADNFDDAVQHLQSAISVIQARIKNVSEALEKEDIKISDDLDVSALSADQKAKLADVKELQKLLPELQEKMTDIKDTKASFTEKLKAMKAHFSGQLSGGSSGKSAFEDGSSSSFSADGTQKDAKPISTSLIRKKRKPDEEAAPTDSKKPRTEDDSNGVTESPKQQQQEEEEEEKKKEKDEAPKSEEEEKMDVQPSDAKEES